MKGLGAIVSMFLFAVSGAETVAQTASVDMLNNQSCAGTRAGFTLGCTAKDFSTNLTFDQPSASALSTCRTGQSYNISVIGQITSSSPIRYDGAYFIGQSGNSPDSNDATKLCSLGIFPSTPVPFNNHETPADACGDFNASSSATLRMNNVLVTCTPVAGTNQLALPYTLVFDNQTSATACTASNITASTKSKCISSTIASVTGVVVNGHLTLTKQTLPDGDPQPFSFTATSSGGAPSATNFTLSDGGTQIIEVPLSSTGGATTLSITESATSGWQPTASITCTTPSGGSAASYVTVNNTTRTITATLNATNGGAICSITNTKIPTVKVTKTTIGVAGGPFSFSATNLASALGSITTAAANTVTPVSPPAIQVSAIGSQVQITEVPVAGYRLTAASCTDANAARTLNTGAIGTLSGNVLTIPAANVVPGADFTCSFTNTKLPTLAITKISNGGTGSFTFTGNNGWSSQALSTVTSGVAVTGATQTLAAASTPTAITETIASGFFLSSVNCSGLGAGGSYTSDPATGAVAFNAAAVAPGANITCTFINTLAAPLLSLGKLPDVASVDARGDLINYTITVGNPGNVPVSSITVNDPLGTVTCTISGNATIAVLGPGANETCTLTYTVTQSDFDGNGGGDGDIDNTASATGSYGATPVTATGSAAVALVILPALAIDKSSNATVPVGAGDIIIYSYAVTNTGNVRLSGITVNDVHGGSGPFPTPSGETLTDNAPFGDSADAIPGDGVWTTLAPGDIVDFSASYTVTQTDVNNQ